MSDIPGFYYDETRRKYFAIGPGFQPPPKKPKILSDLRPIRRKVANIATLLRHRSIGRTDPAGSEPTHHFQLQNARLGTEFSFSPELKLNGKMFVAPEGNVSIHNGPDRSRLVLLNTMEKILPAEIQRNAHRRECIRVRKI